MNGEYDAKLEALKEQHTTFKKDEEKDIEIIHNRIKDLRKETKEAREKMEKRIIVSIDDLKKSQNKLIALITGISGTVFLILIGIIGYFLNTWFSIIMEKLSNMP